MSNTTTERFKRATLKHDFVPESEYGYWETGYWVIKKGTNVLVIGYESDGTAYIEYIDAVFSIDSNLLNF